MIQAEQLSKVIVVALIAVCRMDRYEKVSRRSYLKYVGGLILVAVVAGVAYYATLPAPTPTPTPTPTLTPTPTPKPTPPNLALFPEISGLTVTINGVTTPGTPDARINSIHWDWGDGFSEDHWFPASHAYNTAGTYKVIVTAYQSDGLSTTKSVIVTVTPPSPTPTPTPTPTPMPTVYEEEFREEGHSATLIITVKVENDTRGVPYPTRLAWRECNEYNITVEIKAVFNGTDKVVIKQMNAILLNSQKQIEEKNSSRIRDYELNYTITVSPEFKFTLHPRKGVVEVEPCAAFTLVIEIKSFEYYEGIMKSWPTSKEIEMTICP